MNGGNGMMQEEERAVRPVHLREQDYRQMLERTVAVLERTRHAFRSKQLKQLREEIENVLRAS